MGDANIDVKPRVRSADKDKLHRFLATNQLEQLIKDSTRITADSSSLIDHIYCNHPELYPVSGVCDPALSDHNLIYATRRRHKKDLDTTFIRGRNYRTFNEEEYKESVRNIDWSPVFTSATSTASAVAFRELLLQVIN